MHRLDILQVVLVLFHLPFVYVQLLGCRSCGKFRDQKWRFSGTDEVRQVGNAAGRGKTGSYGSAGCGELSARVLLAGGLSPATKMPGQAGHDENCRAVNWLCINDIPKTNRRRGFKREGESRHGHFQGVRQREGYDERRGLAAGRDAGDCPRILQNKTPKRGPKLVIIRGLLLYLP